MTTGRTSGSSRSVGSLTESGIKIASSVHRARRIRPPSAGAVRDETLKTEIRRVHEDNYRVFGARKMRAVRGRPEEAGRHGAGHAGAVHRPCGSCGAWVCTASAAPSHRAPPGPHRRGQCPADLVNRHFAAFRPNELWVSDITYVRTFGGWVRVALNHRRALQADRGPADLHEPGRLFRGWS